MKKKLIFPVALLFAVSGFFLRRAVLATGFDDNHYPVTNTAWVLLIALTVLAVAFALWATRGLKAQPVFSDAFPPSGLSTVLGILAAGLFVFGNIPALRDGSSALLRIGGILQVAGALTWLSVLSAQKKGVSPSPWAQLLPIVGAVPTFIVRFRTWSLDPIIGDYAFLLLSAVTALLGLYYAAGFPLGLGKPRMTLFFAVTALFFSVVSIPDASLAEALRSLGAALWVVNFALQLLKEHPEKARQEDSEAPEAPEDSPSES